MYSRSILLHQCQWLFVFFQTPLVVSFAKGTQNWWSIYCTQRCKYTPLYAVLLWYIYYQSCVYSAWVLPALVMISWYVGVLNSIRMTNYIINWSLFPLVYSSYTSASTTTSTCNFGTTPARQPPSGFINSEHFLYLTMYGMLFLTWALSVHNLWAAFVWNALVHKILQE